MVFYKIIIMWDIPYKTKRWVIKKYLKNGSCIFIVNNFMLGQLQVHPTSIK